MGFINFWTKIFGQNPHIMGIMSDFSGPIPYGGYDPKEVTIPIIVMGIMSVVIMTRHQNDLSFFLMNTLVIGPENSLKLNLIDNKYSKLVSRVDQWRLPYAKL